MLMIIGGMVWTMVGYPHHFTVGMPTALIIGGIIMAVMGTRYRALRIQGDQKRFVWNEPISFGGGVKQDVTATLGTVQRWAERRGLLQG